jgi:hypothetical protein
MWLYPVPSCPSHPCFKELSVAVINDRIHKVLDLGTNLNPRTGSAAFQEGVASTRGRMFGPILATYMVLSLHVLVTLHRVSRAPALNCGMPISPRTQQGKR